MVTVIVHEDSRGRLSSIAAEGHAGWADAGDDVVCAAVSAILQAAWLGLTAHAGVPVTGERDRGKLVMRWPDDARERPDVAAIAATAALSIEQIARQYPEHVQAIRSTERR
jgi:uncharacterized protein YsxB (DUF464 family)